MGTICTLQNLSLTYPHKVIFKDAFFNLNQGERIGVLGLNGHGKTSLFKILNESVKPDITVPAFIFDKSKEFSLFLVPQELVMSDETSISDYFYEFYPEMKKHKKELDLIAHDLTNSNGDFEKLIDRQSVLFEKLTNLKEDEIHQKYLSLLKYFGIDDLSKNLTSLSGGEQRKIALSLGLSAPHEIILWDEPTNHLDLETIDLFEEELQKSSKSFLIITHDRFLLNNIADKIIHIQHGKIKSFNGTYSQYVEFLLEEEKRRGKEIEKLSNLHRRETAWIRRGAKARRTKSKKRIEDYSNLSSSITDLKNLSHKSVNLNLQSSGRKTKVLAEAKGLSLSYGTRNIFNDFNFMIFKGDKIALLGDNGVGKSSLLKMINTELKEFNGYLKIADGLKIGFFSQKREQLNLEMTPWQLIGDGIDYVIRESGEKIHVASYLENFLFSSEELKRPIKTFSGGEKNRLQLAQFMKHPCDIWIFDEPTNDLDLETIGILEEELKNYEGALIIVSHDRTFIENVTDKSWLIYNKTLEIFEGGLAQAEIFLEAVKLEKELIKKSNENKSNKAKDKISYSERKRHEVILEEIEVLENETKKMKKMIDQFDFKDNSKDIVLEFKKLESLFNDKSLALNLLYEEWDALELKIN